MKHDNISEEMLQSAKKNYEWMGISKPSLAAREPDAQSENCCREVDGLPSGIALPPHERDCGRSHPMRGTNSDDLVEWCIEHET